MIIEIKDTGKGISPENAEKIFIPFFGEKAKSSSGLGLAIVKKFVELLGGELQMESEVNKGTTIRVIIPKT